MSRDSSADWFLTSEDTHELQHRLATAHRAVARAASAVPGSAWAAQPNLSTWSPAQIVEHVVLAEESLRKRIWQHLGDAPRAQPHGTSATMEARLRTVLPSYGKAKAGPSVSTFAGLNQRDVDEALSHSQNEFERLLLHAQSCPV